MHHRNAHRQDRCTLCMDSAPRASDSFTLCSDPTRPKGQTNSQHKSNNNSNNHSFSISNSKSKIEHAGRDIRHILHSWGGAGSLHRVGESEASGQHPCTGCMDYKTRILMLQFQALESRNRGDSLHFGAWGLRLAAQAAVIRTRKRGTESLHRQGIIWTSMS